MNGLIVLDGPDGAGKTTLAEAIVAATSGKYIHLTYRMTKVMDVYQLANLIRAIKMSDSHVVVIDRLWMSEVCYANAYRGGSKWPQLWRDIDRIILKHGGLYVYNLPANLRDHLNAYECLKDQRSEMYSDISPVCIEYHKLWEKIKNWPHVRRYNVQDAVRLPGYMPAFIDRLLADLKTWREEQWPLALETNYYNITGHLSAAKYLFVGGNSKPYRPAWYPYVFGGKPTQHLNTVLDRFDIPEHEIMWTDFTVDSQPFKDLLKSYDLVPFVFGMRQYTAIEKDWLATKGTRDVRGRIGPVHFGTYYNNMRPVLDPEGDLARYNGKVLACDFGGQFLRYEAYGKK